MPLLWPGSAIGGPGGYRFQARIEWRIHIILCEYDLKRCRYHDVQGLGRWVGWHHHMSLVATAQLFLGPDRAVAPKDD